MCYGVKLLNIVAYIILQNAKKVNMMGKNDKVEPLRAIANYMASRACANNNGLQVDLREDECNKRTYFSGQVMRAWYAFKPDI